MTSSTTQQFLLQRAAVVAPVQVADASSFVTGVGSGSAVSIFWNMHLTQRCSKDYRASDG